MPVRREQVAAALKYLGDKADVKRRYERLTSLDQPQDTDAIDMALEMGGSLVPGVGPALAARDFERARRADDKAGMAMATASALPLGKLVGALKGYDPVMREIDVYHGTPHRFPSTETNPLGEFDASKINTGEGAQAYGHGIYLAESPKVAEGYKERLAASSYMKDSQSVPYGKIWQKAADAALGTGAAHPDYSRAISDHVMDWVSGGRKAETFLRYNRVPPSAKPAYEAAVKEYVGLQKTPGNLYTADLPDEMVDRMLDWDKPLGQQPAAVRETVMRYMSVGEKQLPADMRVGQIGDKYVVLQDKPPLPGSTFGVGRSVVKGPKAASEQEAVDAYWNSLTGKDFYDTIGKDLGKNADASDYMRQLGIPGIKYLDAGSRGQGGTGTRNFVVFPGEEKKVKILKRE
jgi:hypothetical protein